MDQIDPDSTPGNGVESEDDQASVDVRGQQIDLSLAKDVDNERPNVGDQVSFTLTVSNSGPSPATGISVRDVLPQGLRYLSSNATQGSYNNSNGIWRIGSIADSRSVTLELRAMVDEILAVNNTAEVITADQPDLDSTPDNGIESEDDQDSAAVTTLVADLALTKSTNNVRPNVGEQVTFTLTVQNDGPDAASGISVLDRLPAGMEFVSATASQGNYDDPSGIWTVGELADRGAATLDIVARVLTAGEQTNTAEVVAVDQADPDSAPGNGVDSEDDQESVTIDPPVIDLVLDKTATPMRPLRRWHAHVCHHGRKRRSRSGNGDRHPGPASQRNHLRQCNTIGRSVRSEHRQLEHRRLGRRQFRHTATADHGR